MEIQSFRSGRVLIVDDEPANVRLLERVLQKAGFNEVRATSEPEKALAIYLEFQPDILLLDLHMPTMTGFAVMEQLQAVVPKDSYFPILVLSGNTLPMMKQQALVYGAKDFLLKPFDVIEVMLRIKNLLETRFLHLALHLQNQQLEAMVGQRTQELEQSRIEVLQRLSLAAEFRDDDTGQHTQRVGRVSALLAKALGLPKEMVGLIRLAAPLHDVGKIAIPDAILLKPEKLTPDEFRVMTTHTSIGGHILSGSQSPLLQLAEQIALTHHECWDGNGYPHGHSGADIPLTGRITSVADVFDALTHKRPYKRAWPIEDAIAEIERLRGTKFDPAVVAVFLALVQKGQLPLDGDDNDETTGEHTA